MISVGNVISNHSKINILPFILRQVKVFGINAENTISINRKKLWKSIFNFRHDKNLIKFFMEFNFNSSSKVFKKIIKSNYSGRIIFKI